MLSGFYLENIDSGCCEKLFDVNVLYGGSKLRFRVIMYIINDMCVG